MFRVTPVFESENLLATGVLMEAKSVEDNGDGILFNVFCYNAENGIVLDYATGKNSLGEFYLEKTDLNTSTNSLIDSSSADINYVSNEKEDVTIVADSILQDNFSFIINTSTKKFHILSCRYVDTISEKNRLESYLSPSELFSQGYEACKVCK